MATTPDRNAAFEDDGFLTYRVREATASQRSVHVQQVGMKAAGLSVIPRQWTPPFFVVSTRAYASWRELDSNRETFLLSLAQEVSAAAGHWPDNWNRGLLLRSSAVGESLADRGENETGAFPADYDAARISAGIGSIYA